MNELFFTRLYVASASSRSDLIETVERVLGASSDMSTITTAVASSYVGTSDDYDRAAIERDPTDFIRYPYSLEIEAEPGATLERYLEVVASIMTALHRAGATVVASCDWEDLLPGEGKLGAAFEDAEIGKFLAEPVPPGGAKGTTWGAHMESWRARCRALGPRAPAAFLAALEHGSEIAQYVALIGLREHGYTAFAEGYGAEIVYKVTPPGLAERVIRPKHPPVDPG